MSGLAQTSEEGGYSFVDRSGAKASYWLTRAAMNLDRAVQCCDTDDSEEIDALERRCNELSAKLKKGGR